MRTVTLTRPATSDPDRTSLPENPQSPVPAARVPTLVVLEVPEIPDQTLEEIAEIAQLCRGAVTLLRPIDHTRWVQALDDPLTESALRAVGQTYLRDVVKRLQVGGVYASTKVTIGLTLEQAIEETARECAAGVIVIAHSPTHQSFSADACFARIN